MTEPAGKISTDGASRLKGPACVRRGERKPPDAA